jgi:hypothetical protein
MRIEPMSRRTLSEKLAALMLGASLPALALAEDVAGLAFRDSPACRANEIPLGQPARIEAKREGPRLVLDVAVNFGCGTTAGRARAEESDGEVRLFADTILPGYPTPACKCTRHLLYDFETRWQGPMRIVFVKDGRPEGEGRLEPQ